MSYDCADVVGDITGALHAAGVPMLDPENESHNLAEVSLLAELCIDLYPLVRGLLAGDRTAEALAAKMREIDGAAERLAAEYDEQETEEESDE